MAVAFVCALLAFPVAPLGARDDSHARLIAYANAEREHRGLPPLTEDRALDRFALDYARTLARGRYFSHTAPDGTTFADRLRQARYRYRWAAENIAENADVVAAHASFVQSAPHFANIVDPSARRMGTAVLPLESGLEIVVEDFSD